METCEECGCSLGTIPGYCYECSWIVGGEATSPEEWEAKVDAAMKIQRECARMLAAVKGGAK